MTPLPIALLFLNEVVESWSLSLLLDPPEVSQGLDDLVVINDPLLSNPPEHNVVKGFSCTDSRSAGHQTSFRVWILE